MKEHLIWHADTNYGTHILIMFLLALSPFVVILFDILAFSTIVSEYLILGLAAYCFVFFGILFTARLAERHLNILTSIMFAVFLVGLAFAFVVFDIRPDALSEMQISEEQRFAELSCPAMREEIIESYTPERKMQIFSAKCQ